MRPYYQDEYVTLYHGDCREVLPTLGSGYALVSDPPYPNNAGHFDADIGVARDVLYAGGFDQVLAFWTELERPPVRAPLVAVHIWHRTNVNGRPYEPIYHFDTSGIKRRSVVIPHHAVFGGVGPGCWEYLGHPTQKPVDLMRHLIQKVTLGKVFDPFAGSGSTLRAAKDLGRHSVGVEVNERYCEIAARRLSQGVLDFGGAA